MCSHVRHVMTRSSSDKTSRHSRSRFHLRPIIGLERPFKSLFTKPVPIVPLFIKMLITQTDGSWRAFTALKSWSRETADIDCGQAVDQTPDLPPTSLLMPVNCKMLPHGSELSEIAPFVRIEASGSPDSSLTVRPMLVLYLVGGLRLLTQNDRESRVSLNMPSG